MSLSTASTIDSLLAAHTFDVRHSCPRLHVAAASSGSGSLYAAWGGTSQVPALDAPLSDAALESDARAFLPELAAAQRLDGFDAKGEPVLIPNDVPITVKMLPTHTAVSRVLFVIDHVAACRGTDCDRSLSQGFACDWDSPNGQQAKCRALKGMKPIVDPTSDRTAVTAIPLEFVPGSRFVYGPSLDWAGFMVEQLSGLSLEDYFQKHIFKPLGISDISFDWS